LAVDSLAKTPVVILKEVSRERTLPTWIGFLEANAIASELEGITFSRPMAHDLVKNIMGLIDVKVSKVEICDGLEGRTRRQIETGKNEGVVARGIMAMTEILSTHTGVSSFILERRNLNADKTW